MPSVVAIDECMKQWGQDWAAQNGLPDYFGALWRNINEYYDAVNSRFRHQLNFGKVLGNMIAPAHWVAPIPWGNTLRQVTNDGAPLPHLSFPFTEKHGPTITGNGSAESSTEKDDLACVCSANDLIFSATIVTYTSL